MNNINQHNDLLPEKNTQIGMRQLESNLLRSLSRFSISKYFDFEFSEQYESDIQLVHIEGKKSKLSINIKSLCDKYLLTEGEVVCVVLIHLEKLGEDLQLQKRRVRGAYFNQMNEYISGLDEHQKFAYVQLEEILRTIVGIKHLFTQSAFSFLRKDLVSLYMKKIYSQRDLSSLPMHIQFLQCLFIERLESQSRVQDVMKERKNKDDDIGNQESVGRSLFDFKRYKDSLVDSSMNLLSVLTHDFLIKYTSCTVSDKVRSLVGKVRNLEALGYSHLDKTTNHKSLLTVRSSSIRNLIAPYYFALLSEDDSIGEDLLRVHDVSVGVDKMEQNEEVNLDREDSPFFGSSWVLLNKKDVSPYSLYYSKNELQFELFPDIHSHKTPDAYEDLITTTITAEKATRNKKSFSYLEERAKRYMRQGVGKDRDGTKTYQGVLQSLQEYESFYAEVKKLKDPKSGKLIIEEINEIFNEIRMHRAERGRWKVKAPVSLERGDSISSPHLVRGVIELMAGNDNPMMMKKLYKSERVKELVGECNITLILDGSGSMAGEKEKQQKLMIFSFTEGITKGHKALQSDCLTEPLSLSTSVTMFHGGKDILVLKEENSDFTDHDRLHMFSALTGLNGGTDDYAAIAQKIKDLKKKGPDYLGRLKGGKIKEIVIVSTDGASGNKEELKKQLTMLRDFGVIVFAIGFTSEAKSVIKSYNTTHHDYFGKGVYIENMNHLAPTLRSLLGPHLKSLY